jgi:acetyl esterase/lipase
VQGQYSCEHELTQASQDPYPFAIDEVVDVYRSIVESTGTLLGMSGRHLNIIMTGDSAGATIAVNAVLRLIETREQRPLPLPSAMVLSYAALDFNFASWMSPANLHALRSEQSSSHLANLAETKDHFKHKSPLSMVSERRSSLRRRKSWRDSARPGSSRPRRMSTLAEDAVLADVEGEDDAPHAFAASPEGPSTPLTQSTLERHQIEMSKPAEKKDVAAIGTRMTMTSRTGYFQDKIITPSMVRDHSGSVSAV